MGEVLLHPQARRLPAPMISSDPLPDDAVPAVVVGDVMARIVKDFALLTVMLGRDAVRVHAPLLAEEGIEGAR